MPLLYDLSVTGISNVKRGLRSIETEMARHNRSMVAGAKATEAKVAAVRNAGYRTNAAAATTAAAAQATALQKAQAKGHALRLRQIEKEQAAALRAANAEYERRRRNSERLAIAQRQAIRGGAISGATRPLAAVGRTASAAIGMGGAFIVGSAVAKQFSIEKSAAMLANKAFGTPGETRTRGQIKASLLAQSEAIAGRSGNRAGVVEAIDKFVAISGSLKGAQAQAGFMADLSAATGAEMSDVGRTGGQVLQNIAATRGLDLGNQKDFNEAMRATQTILAAMAGQAKIGSIEFADLATQMGKVMSATARYEGDVADLTNQMGAIGQLAIAGGAASPQEAMTAMMRFSDDLVQNAERFEKLAAREGMKRSFFTDKTRTTLRDPTEIMMDMLEVTRGDLSKGKRIFGIRAMKAFEPFQKAYVSAGGVRDHEAGISAVRAQVERFKGAGMTTTEVAASARFAREQKGAKLAIALENLQSKVGKDLVPVIDDLVPAFQELAGLLKEVSPYLAAFLKAFAKNPLAVGGSLLAGRMALGAGAGMLSGAYRTAGAFGATTGGAVTATGAPVTTGGVAGVAALGAGRGATPGNVVNATMIGASIGGAVASAISIWGRSEVERMETETDAVVKQASIGDAKKAGIRVKEMLVREKTAKEGSVAAKIATGALTAQGGQYGAMYLAPAEVTEASERSGAALASTLSPVGGQREFNIRNLENAETIAEHRVAMQEFMAEFAQQTKDATHALSDFNAKVSATGAANRSGSSSPVKP